jgi:WhiB family transcriptional regulator, redox-sensing transcriptional regulator
MNDAYRPPPVTDDWDWRMLGRCHTRSASRFFHPNDDMGRVSRRLREASAKLICVSCPVRAECAAHALVNNEGFGVWGGFTEAERILLRQSGWRDALDGSGRKADVSRLERRLRSAGLLRAHPARA